MPSEKDGVMIILSSPSGAGKTTLVKKLSQKGFELKKTQKSQLIIHSNPQIFNQWGFVSEELPFKQLSLIPDDETIVDF